MFRGFLEDVHDMLKAPRQLLISSPSRGAVGPRGKETTDASPKPLITEKLKFMVIGFNRSLSLVTNTFYFIFLWVGKKNEISNSFFVE